MWESCLFCLGGVEIFLKGGENKFFFCVSNLGGDSVFLVSHCLLIYIYELFMIYVFIVCYVKSRFYFLFTCIFHTCVYVFVECFRNIQVDSVILLPTLTIDR